MENPEYQKKVIRAAITVLSKWQVIISCLASVSTLAFVIGWFDSKSYFENMGCPWLLHSAPIEYILSQSWYPISMLLLFGYFSITDLIERRAHVRTIRFGLIYGNLIIVILMFSIPILNHFKQYTFSTIVTGLLVIVLMYVAICSITAMIWNAIAAEKEFNSLSIYFAYSFIVFGLWFLPMYSGNSRCNADIDYKTSNLCKVSL